MLTAERWAALACRVLLRPLADEAALTPARVEALVRARRGRPRLAGLLPLAILAAAGRRRLCPWLPVPRLERLERALLTELLVPAAGLDAAGQPAAWRNPFARFDSQEPARSASSRAGA